MRKLKYVKLFESFLILEKYGELTPFYHITDQKYKQSILNAINQSKSQNRGQGKGLYVFEDLIEAEQTQVGGTGDVTLMNRNFNLLIEINAVLNETNFGIDYELMAKAERNITTTDFGKNEQLTPLAYAQKCFFYQELKLKKAGEVINNDTFANGKFYYNYLKNTTEPNQFGTTILLISKTPINPTDFVSDYGNGDLPTVINKGKNNPEWGYCFLVPRDVTALDAGAVKAYMVSLDNLHIRFKQRIKYYLMNNIKNLVLRYIGPDIKPSRYKLKDDAGNWGEWIENQ